DGEVPRPETERDRRPRQRREQGAQRRRARDRPEYRRGEEEEQQRHAHRDDQQRGREISEQDVLQHVRREQIVLRDPVQRRDERGERDGESGGEERGAIPAREVGASPRAKPDESVAEERGGNGGCDDREHGWIVPLRTHPVGQYIGTRYRRKRRTEV